MSYDDDDGLDNLGLSARTTDYLRKQAQAQEKQQQQQTTHYTDAERAHIDHRFAEIDAEFDDAGKFIGQCLRELETSLRKEIAELAKQKPKVVLIDVAGALDRRAERAIEKTLAGMREQITAEVRKALYEEQHKILDLPQLPRKRA